MGGVVDRLGSRCALTGRFLSTCELRGTATSKHISLTRQQKRSRSVACIQVFMVGAGEEGISVRTTILPPRDFGCKIWHGLLTALELQQHAPLALMQCAWQCVFASLVQTAKSAWSGRWARSLRFKTI